MNKLIQHPVKEIEMSHHDMMIDTGFGQNALLGGSAV